MAKHILHWRFLTNFLEASIKRTFVKGDFTQKMKSPDKLEFID